MPILNVNGKDYEGKVNFKFDSLAKEKYYGEDKDGNKSSGIKNIYEKLLNLDTQGLVGFWDCALNFHKDRPKLFQIEEALEKEIEKHGETEPLFKECFKVMDESGFFKSQAKQYWKDIEEVQDFAEDDKQEKQLETYQKRMQANRLRLLDQPEVETEEEIQAS